LYQRIHALSSRRACSKLTKLCCQTHSSFRLRTKRSMIAFCSGVYAAPAMKTGLRKGLDDGTE
jgi:hypothetical protein